MEKLVSVIIPAYNAEKYIRSCVESVINQDYKNMEIIVVNDGSIDKTEAIVKSMAEDDSRVVLINQQNKGPSAARNNGLQSCKGEYVFFLDSDDWIEEECIGTLLNIAIQKDVEIVFLIITRTMKIDRLSIIYMIKVLCIILIVPRIIIFGT